MSRDLEAHLAQEILESERLRMAILAALFALLTLAFPLFATVFHHEYRRTFDSPAMLWHAMAISGALVAYGMLARRLRRNQRAEPAHLDGGTPRGDAVRSRRTRGAAERKQYSVTGSVAILASRIEQLNKQFGSRLLVSREVLERAGEEGAGAVALGPVDVKGRAAPIEVYRLA